MENMYIKGGGNMKKRVFRERYNQVEETDVIEEVIKEIVEESVEEKKTEPKKRGRKKSVKSDK